MGLEDGTTQRASVQAEPDCDSHGIGLTAWSCLAGIRARRFRQWDALAQPVTGALRRGCRNQAKCYRGAWQRLPLRTPIRLLRARCRSIVGRNLDRERFISPSRLTRFALFKLTHHQREDIRADADSHRVCSGKAITSHPKLFLWVSLGLLSRSVWEWRS
jgi:hypothetical protein